MYQGQLQSLPLLAERRWPGAPVRRSNRQQKMVVVLVLLALGAGAIFAGRIGRRQAEARRQGIELHHVDRAPGPAPAPSPGAR